MTQANFPRKDNEFNTYINEAVPYLNTHQARLNVDMTQLGELNDLFNDPGGTEGWQQIWPQSQSPNQRTTTITGKKNQLREDITETLRIIYDDVPESALTQDDRDILRLYERDDVRSERPPITTAPFVDLKVLDGGRVRISCRVEGDASRPSRHPDADFIEVKYVLQNVNSGAPDNPEELSDRTTSTRAAFEMELGVENAGKRLFCFVRWANLSEPEKSGPWSQVMTIVISD